MSEKIKSNNKRNQALISPKGSSMHFWGICCESGKQYAQVVGQRFRITMAVLDPNSFKKEHSNRIVSLIVNRDDIEYLLCVLKHGEIHQSSLNLIFDKGEKVKFYLNGHGKVYLSGYQLTDSERDVSNDENGYLCPLVEVKAKNKKMDSSMSPKDQKKAKSKKMKSDKSESPGGPIWSTLLSQNDVDDDDEEDEDFSLSEEDLDSEEESGSDGDDIEDDDDDDDDDDDEEEDEDEEGDEDEEEDEDSEKEVVVNSHGSQKRKKTDKASVQKRSRNDSLNSTSKSVKKVKNAADTVVCIDDDETSDSDSDSDDISSFHETMSAGNTPMPKKKTKEVSNETKSKEVSNETKKSKKKKKYEMFNVSDPSIKSENEKSSNESTPKSQGKSHPVVMKNGVEIQDLLIGRGPEAISGKMVHVFYVGRLANKKIFDSRLPGKKPFSFKLGAHQVIKGWDVGLEGMKVGGKRRLKIPPHMAYGKAGVEGIPPNSTLSFMVELQAVS